VLKNKRIGLIDSRLKQPEYKKKEMKVEQFQFSEFPSTINNNKTVNDSFSLSLIPQSTKSKKRGDTSRRYPIKTNLVLLSL